MIPDFTRKLVERSIVLVGGTALISMTLLILMDVLARILLRSGIPFTAEIVSTYLMVGVSFIPIALAEFYRRHIVATVLVDRFPEILQRWFVNIADLLSLIIYGLIAYQTMIVAIAHTNRRTFIEVGTRQFETWLSYWILPLAFSIMALLLMFRFITGSLELRFSSNEDRTGRRP